MGRRTLAGTRHVRLTALAVAVCLLGAACSTAPSQPDATATDDRPTTPPGPTRSAAPEPSEPSPTPEPSATTPTITFETIELGSPEVAATGLEAPWSILHLGDSILVSERDSGRIVEVTADNREVGVIEDVAARSEGGLLGLATTADTLYAYLTTPDDNRVIAAALTGGPGNFALGPQRVLIAGIPKSDVHNGGRIAFGPDDHLYVTTGDAAASSSAQDLESLAGKILRLTPEGDVPADNPYPGSPVFTSGHRNPQGLAWTPDGRMWASEFGQNTWDEVNEIVAGANYGWPIVEGIGHDDDYRDPIAQFEPGEASPSGIVAVGEALAMAALRGERLWLIDPDTGESRAEFIGEFGRLRDVAYDGSLWILSNNTDGRGSPRNGDDRLLKVAVAAAGA